MPEYGFFTDTTLCIGCKACEVACKQWNQLPDDGFLFTGMSFDNTGHLGASTWRHVAFVERQAPLPGQGSPRDGVDGGFQAFGELMPAGQPPPTSLLHDISPTHIETPPMERAQGQPDEAAPERAGGLGGRSLTAPLQQDHHFPVTIATDDEDPMRSAPARTMASA
jgi:hypothetical protein